MLGSPGVQPKTIMASSRQPFVGKPRTLSLFALLAFSIPTASAESPPQLPKVNLELFQNSVRQQISDVYETAVRNPNHADTNGRLGMLLYAYEQYEAAEPCFERAMFFAPPDYRWPYYLGRTRSILREHGQAVTALEAALQLNPGYLPARLKLGEALLDAGDAEKAGKALQAVVTEYPGSAAAHYGLGRYFTHRREPDRAVAHLQKACELFPGFGAAHFALARVYRDQGDHQKAQAHLLLYQKDKLTWPPAEDPLLASIQELKTGANARLRKGVLLAESGQLEAAVDEHEAALAADQGLVQAHIHLIALYGRLGNAAKAEEHYRSAVRINPNLSESHYNFAVLLIQQERYREAEEPLRAALKLNPTHALALTNLGYVLMVGGRLDEAIESYRAAITVQPRNRTAHFNLGRILVQQGRLQEAIAHLLETRTPEDADTPRYLHAIGAAYARAGDRTLARNYLEEARLKALQLKQTDLVSSIDKDLQTLQKLVRQP